MNHLIKYRGLWVPTLITVISLVLLSGIHTVSSAEERGSISVFVPHNAAGLSDENLVDGLVALPLVLRISHADWERGSLYLDLKITEEPLSIETVYQDLATILEFSFENKDNVNQVYLRFEAVDPWSKSRYLVLAANMKKNEWDHSLLMELKSLKNEPFSDRLVQGLHLTLTNLWKKQFISG